MSIPTKNIYLNIDWVNALRDVTVSEAIDYLQRFSAEDVLTVQLDGDTHGCEIISNIAQIVPLSRCEIKAEKIERLRQQIARWEESKKYYQKDTHRLDMTDRIANCDKQITLLTEKLGKAENE